ncbi:MAG: hypothetical protein ACKO6E_08440, partial [Planctomycetota bacterium]
LELEKAAEHGAQCGVKIKKPSDSEGGYTSPAQIATLTGTGARWGSDSGYYDSEKAAQTAAE